MPFVHPYKAIFFYYIMTYILDILSAIKKGDNQRTQELYIRKML